MRLSKTDRLSYPVKGAVKWGIGTLNRPVAVHRLQRTIARTPHPFRIEVGGHRFTRPGWICTDNGWRTPHFMDAAAAWPFPSSCAALVYSDNVVEHISFEGNRRLFREAHRVLHPGGRIRLATPDVRRLAELYLSGSLEADWHVEELRRRGYAAHHHIDLLRVVFHEAGHHVGYLWDFDSLSTELRQAGFSGVRRFESGLSDTPDFVGLERREERPSSPIMLVVEAVRH